MIPRYFGTWSLARTIVDGLTQDTTACRGTATLRADGARMRYDETVTLELGGRPMRATRAYYYALDGDSIIATFADGGPFFRSVIGPDGCARASHDCRDDRYDGTFILRDGDRWETRWDVAGAKPLRIVTRYARVSAG